MIKNKIFCARCGTEFFSEHWGGGSIEHNNWTDEHNINVHIFRNKLIETYDLRNDNYCNVKDIPKSRVEQIHNCVKIYLEQNHKDLLNEFNEYFQNRQSIIDKIFSSGDNQKYKEKLTPHWAKMNKIIDLYKKLDGENCEFRFGICKNLEDLSNKYLIHTKDGIYYID